MSRSTYLCPGLFVLLAMAPSQGGKDGKGAGSQTGGALAVPDLSQVVLRPRLVTEKIESAIKKGLAYLVRNQDRSGAWRSAGRYDDPVAEKALEDARRHLSISGGAYHLYSHLYLSQALYQKGGKDWEDYYNRMSRWLLGRQGSGGAWQGDNVGQIYGTAIALTVLQLPYAHLPIYQR